jgi:hypothetical protein
MLRTVVATSIVLAVACGSKDATPAQVGAGPGYTPLVANGIRAIASDCKITKTGANEHHKCIGVKGVIDVAVASDKMTDLKIKLRAMIFAEAKGHLSHALRPVLGQPGVQELMAKVEALKTGDRTELAIGNGSITVVAGGTSKLAPEFELAITWGVTR